MSEDAPVLEKLTAAEIKEIFDDVGLPYSTCLDCSGRLPHKLTPEEQEIVASFQRKLLDGMVEMPPEFNKVFTDNLEDLLA